MIKKIINYLSFGFLFKEDKLSYPPEFCEIVYTDTAIRNGIEDLQNKVIVRYKYNQKTQKIEVYKIYGYSDSILQILRDKMNLPIYDSTFEENKFKTFAEVNLNEVIYDKY